MDTKQKDIFRRLKGYSHGFYAYATEEEKQAYNAKVKELQAKIIADVNRAPEIIAEAFATYYAVQKANARQICGDEMRRRVESDR